MKYTLKDIAEKCGVSQSTVSLVLNGKPGISENTRKRVLEVAENFNIKLEKSILNGFNKGTIAFLKIARHGHTVNPDHDVFIASYIEGLSLEARANNYVLEVIPLFNKEMDMAQIIKSLNHETFVGFVILGTELSYEDFTVLKSLKLPIVILDSYHEIMDFDFVDMDNFNSVYQIIENLINNGHQKIGFLRSNTEVQNFRLREKAFKEVLDYFKISKENQFIYTVESTFNGAYQDVLKILENKNTDLPTAIFAINDVVAYGCIKALKEKKIKIPNDISIIGFDDLPMSAMSDPPLTSMSVNKIRMGQTAIQLLISRIKLCGRKPSEKILIGGNLKTRKSVKSIK